jgi:DNA invertase Pin-like site-specific DNA recombinase
MNTATKRVALYARVSTNGQTTKQQLEALREVGVRGGWQIDEEHIYVDHGISGAKGREERPALDRMLKAATRRAFDLIAAWSVDRLGRSLQHLVELLNEIHAAGVDLYLHQQAVDTTTPGGRALFQMMGVFAEFERALIRERVTAGVRRAQKHGTRSGRPIGRQRVPVETEVRIRKLRREGLAIG